MIDVEQSYRQYGPLVLRRCRRLLRDDALALDAMQDVFVQAMRRRDQLHDAAPAALFLRMATNVCLDRLRAEAAGKFPEKVTAFREEMAAHGKYGQPCPRCGARIQRIRYAANETNYCPACQTGGRLLADRALSRLLREDWPRPLEELEALKRR